MKICMFTNTYLPHVGGVARSVSTFAEDLRKAGHAVRIIAPAFPGMSKETTGDVVRVPAIQNFNGSDFSVRIPVPGIIDDTIREFKPDIIHSHHPFLLGDAALRTSRFYDLPLVFTHHTLYENYTHYVPLDSKTLKRFVINLATQYANLCNQVIAPSTSVRNLLLERGVKSPVEVLPTGIDLDFFSQGDGRRFRQKYAINADSIIIGHVGRLATEKNLPFLAAGVARYLKKNENACFVVAGKGDAEGYIREIFRENNIADRLVMPGNFTGNELADCYAAADIFVFASFSETQGLVLAEAMAASTPVIALSASGVNDVVKDKINGVKLPADISEAGFARALADALSDGQRLDCWSRNAFETAREFSGEKSAARLAALYEKTITGGHYPHVTEIDILDSVLLAIKTEWELLHEKTVAAVNSFSGERTER
jgi:glycosyltransferase involved in cell wall biosynthesis